MKLTDVLAEKDFIFALCTFIDEFKRSAATEKERLISDEPKELGDKEKRCILAAVAHKIANDNRIGVPAWTSKSIYVMDYPIYSHNTKNSEYQEFLIASTPFEFACRNIFFGEDAIERA